MKSILGTDIPTSTRGVLYLCHFTGREITVLNELFFESSFEALEAYANIPNPESQLVTGITFDVLIMELEKLHSDMKDPVWLENLSNVL